MTEAIGAERRLAVVGGQADFATSEKLAMRGRLTLSSGACYRDRATRQPARDNVARSSREAALNAALYFRRRWREQSDVGIMLVEME
jgi:hypothetical protein